MIRRFRSDWLEYLIGVFLLCTAAGAGFQPAPLGGPLGVPPRFYVSILILAACLAFSAHLAARRPKIRQMMLAIAAVICLLETIWFVRADAYGPAVWCFMFAMAAAAVISGRFSAGRTAADTLLPLMMGLCVIATAAAEGIRDVVGGAYQREHLMQALGVPDAAAIPLLVAVGAFMLWVELGASVGRKTRLAAAALLSAATGLLAADRAVSGFASGVGGAMAFTSAFLLLERFFPDFVLIVPDEELSAATAEHRTVYQYEQIGEVGVWAVIACGAVYVQLAPDVRLDLFFTSIFCSMLLQLWFTHLKPLRQRDARHYLVALLLFIASLLLSVQATGGIRSPFALFSFSTVVAASVVVPSAWILLPALEITAYFLAVVVVEWLSGALARQDASTAVFIIFSVAVTAVYSTLISRRREKSESDLMAVNAKLTETLALAEKERVSIDLQTTDLKTLNDDLIETRTALMNVLEDVEESKRRIEADFRRDTAIFEAVGEALVAAGGDGAIFLFNPTASKILRVPRDEAIGKPIRSILRFAPEDSDAVAPTFDAPFAGRAGRLPDKAVVFDVEEKRVPVSGTVAPFLGESGEVRGVVAAFRDVTVERELDRQKSGFVSIASHQLRTPLSAMRWYVDLLLGGDAGRINKQQKEFLTDVGASVARMIKLVGDLLDVSRIESGKTMMKMAPFDLTQMLRSIIGEFDVSAKKKKLTLDSRVPETLPTVTGDANALRQAVGNLVANAVNYTPEGGTVSMSAKKDGEGITVEVRDTGIGIPTAQQHRLFERFFRAENAVARETVGSGLGLYIVRQIVEAHGGRVWFSSEEGKGSVFSVSLPLARKDATLGEKSP